MQSGLTIENSKDGDVHLLTLSGSLDGHSFVELEKLLRKILGTTAKAVILDLSRLHFIASAGVGVFISCQQSAQQNAKRFVLVDPTAPVREVFEILGLSSLFRIYDDLNSARAAIASQS